MAEIPTEEAAFRIYLINLLRDPEMSQAIHIYSDLDQSKDSQHHSVGPRKTQAASN